MSINDHANRLAAEILRMGPNGFRLLKNSQDIIVNALRAYARLPVTADGVKVIPGMMLYRKGGICIAEMNCKDTRDVSEIDDWFTSYYSSREALTAAEAGKGKP